MSYQLRPDVESLFMYAVSAEFLPELAVERVFPFVC